MLNDPFAVGLHLLLFHKGNHCLKLQLDTMCRDGCTHVALQIEYKKWKSTSGRSVCFVSIFSW